MQIRLKPWTENERLYFYRQSQQLSGQTGQIGILRADFDRDGTGFFSSLEDIRPDLKTEEFKAEFDNVINALRFETDGTPLGGRRNLSSFLNRQEDAKLPGDEEWYGFRVDTDKYSYFFRLKPHAGDYNVYVWCYKRDWLDEHMARAERGIRFIDSGYNDKFTIGPFFVIDKHLQFVLETCRNYTDIWSFIFKNSIKRIIGDGQKANFKPKSFFTK